MNYFIRFSFLFLFAFFVNNAHAQYRSGAVHLQVESATADAGGTVCLTVRGLGLSDVMGMQFSLKWDPGVLAFSEVKDLQLPGMNSSDFGLRFTDDGNLTMVYLVPTGQNLPDESDLFTLCFQAAGIAGAVTPVSFSNFPTALEFVTDIDNVAQIIPNYSLYGGTVHIGEAVAPLALEAQGQLLTTCLIDGKTDLAVKATGGTAPFTYSWNGPGGLVASGSTVTAIQEGTYRVTVSDAAGSLVEAHYQITGTDLRISDVQQADASCAAISDGEVTVAATGGKKGLSYSWSTGETGASITGLPGGAYSVTVSDAFGCATTVSATVASGAGVGLTPELSAPHCGQSDGSILLNAASSNAGPLTYSWSDGSSDADRHNLAPGTYSVTVTDANECSATDTVHFSWTPIAVTLSSNCGATPTNTIEYNAQATAQGGTHPYEFAWSTGAQETQVQSSNLLLPGAGSYGVTVTDAEGCSEVQTIEVPVCGADRPVWPGDTDASGTVDQFDLLNIGLGYGLTGPAREAASLDWIAQAAVSWDESTPDSQTDMKFADADGNGRIEVADTIAIAQHWGQQTETPGSLPNLSPTSGDLLLFVDTATLLPAQQVSLPIVLGAAGGDPVDNAYGIAFSIVYDSLAVIPESVHINSQDSWLADAGSNLLVMQHNNPAAHRLDVALTRTDQQGRSGQGELTRLLFTLIDAVPEPEMEYALPFRIENIRFIDANEQLLPVTPLETISTMRLTTAINDPALYRQIRLFPNPANNWLYIKAPRVKLEKVELFSGSGKIVGSWQNSRRLDISGLRAGIYFVRLAAEEGVVVKRVVVE